MKYISTGTIMVGAEPIEKPVGTKEFRKAFERVAMRDDWGCLYTYDFSAWKIWQAAIRHERKRLSAKPGDSRG